MGNSAQPDLRDQLTGNVIGCAMDVHRAMGPGLLETVYETCLAFEFASRDISFQRQVHLPLIYKGKELDAGFRLDFVVANRLILELKAVERIAPIHEAQLLSYMRLSGLKIGLLINFNTEVLKNGIRRLVL